MRRTKTLVKSSQRRRGGLIFGNNLPNFEHGSTFGRILPPLNGEFKFLGEFGGSLVTGASGQRGFGSSRGFVTPAFPKKTKCKPICMPGSSFMHIVTNKCIQK
jgi:hypothetical protein